MKVRFTRRARIQLAAIQAYLGPRSPKSARRVAEAIQRSVANIVAFPLAGTRATPLSRRRWAVADAPYVIIYALHDERDEITILGIFHAAENRDDRMK